MFLNIPADFLADYGSFQQQHRICCNGEYRNGDCDRNIDGDGGGTGGGGDSDRCSGDSDKMEAMVTALFVLRVTVMVTVAGR